MRSRGAIEARAVYRKEDFAIAGCIATIAQDGTLQVIQGTGHPRGHAETDGLPSPTAPERVTTVTTTAMPPGSEPTPAASADRRCPGR